MINAGGPCTRCPRDVAGPAPIPRERLLPDLARRQSTNPRTLLPPAPLVSRVSPGPPLVHGVPWHPVRHTRNPLATGTPSASLVQARRGAPGAPGAPAPVPVGLAAPPSHARINRVTSDADAVHSRRTGNEQPMAFACPRTPGTHRLHPRRAGDSLPVAREPGRVGPGHHGGERPFDPGAPNPSHRTTNGREPFLPHSSLPPITRAIPHSAVRGS